MFTIYSTEIGPATMFIPRNSPSVDEWEYFLLSNHISLYMRPADNLENIFEPILIVCFERIASAWSIG